MQSWFSQLTVAKQVGIFGQDAKCEAVSELRLRHMLKKGKKRKKIDEVDDGREPTLTVWYKPLHS